MARGIVTWWVKKIFRAAGWPVRALELLAGLAALFLLAQCASPMTLNNTTKAFVEDGLTQLFVASSTFTEAGVAKTTVASGTSLTSQVTLVNPKNLNATYSLSWNVANTCFSALPPASPTVNSTTSLSFGFTLSSAAEHQDIVFTLAIFVPATGKTYPSQSFKVHCDSPPNAATNLSIGRDGSSKAYIEFTLPTTATDDDLTSATLVYQDVDTPATPGPVNTVTVVLSSLTAATSSMGTTLTDLLSSVTAAKYYFAPQVTSGHAYAYQVVLIDGIGQKSASSTVGASGIFYTLSYNNNGGTGSIATTTWAWGASATVAASTAMSRSGYVVTSWNTQANGSGVSVASGGSGTLTMNSGNVTLCAQWGGTLSYNANLGTGSIATTTWAPGASATVASAAPMSRSGYSVSSWNTQANGLGVSVFSDGTGTLIMNSGNVTLYAQWTAIPYTVTYSSSGSSSGTVPAGPTVYSANTTVTVLGNTGSLTGTNLVFEGWSTVSGGGGTNYQQGDTFSITGNVTLYPMWFTVSGTVITAIQGSPTSVTIPEGVTDIGTAFRNITSLTSVSLPSTLSTVVVQAFDGCTNLASITSANASYTVVNGALIHGTTLMLVPAKLTGTFNIPPGITSIDAYAFDSCNLLTSIVIPASMTTISGNGFSGVANLASMTIPATVTAISNFAFYNSSIANLYMPTVVTPATLGTSSPFPAGGITIHVPLTADIAIYQAVSPWNLYTFTSP